MEKLIVGVSLEAIFEIESSVIQLNDVQKDKKEFLFSKGPIFNLIEMLTNLNQHQSEFLIEVIVISDHSPSLSTSLFESLDYYQLEISQVVLTGSDDITPYLRALEIELYFSSSQHLILDASQCGILAGEVINRKSRAYRFAFDHRLFADEVGYSVLGKWIPLLGLLQRSSQEVGVGIITTRCYSLESWVKELFKIAQCRIDEICFVGSGECREVSRLFNFLIYFEGVKRETLKAGPPPKCVLNIDF